MKKQLLLKKYVCRTPITSILLAGSRLKYEKAFSEHELLMKVAIDFEKGVLSMESNLHFILAIAKNKAADAFLDYTEKLFIETEIYPATTIDLENPTVGELVFSLNGNIRTGTSLRHCTGLLEVNREIKSPGNQWHLNFFLMDTDLDDFGIEFKLPILTDSLDVANYN